MKIGLLTAWSAEFDDLAALTNPSKRAYCKSRRYEFVHWRVKGEWDSWLKVKMIREQLPRFDAVLWMDADAIIMADRRGVEQVPGTSITFAADVYGINDGISVTRRTVWSETFWFAVDTGRIHVNPAQWGSQEAVIRFAQAAPYRNHVTLAPQNVMNSYLNSEYDRPAAWPGNYLPGDWILHLPGIPNERRLKLAAEYAAKSSLHVEHSHD